MSRVSHQTQEGHLDCAGLVVPCMLLPGEGASAFLQRCCEENLIAKCRDLLNLLETSKSVNAFDLMLNDAALGALASVAGMHETSLHHLSMKLLLSASGPVVRQGLHEWPADARISQMRTVCPGCLAERPYGRAVWEFVQAPVCLAHGRMLISRCPRCDIALSWTHPGVSLCSTCGHDLAGPGRQTVERSVLEAARLVQYPRMHALGSLKYSAPIDAMEVSGLLRLCLLPEVGESADHGLTRQLDSYGVDRRIAALRLLGESMVGSRIDSECLRTRLLRRWPYNVALDFEQQNDLLEEMCQTVELSQDVTRLLLYGTDTPPYPAAAHLFQNRPPQLRTLHELAAYVGGEPQVVREIVRKYGQPVPPRMGAGYDMDEVLALKRLLTSVWSGTRFDAMCGFPGLAAALVQIRVVDGLTCDDGSLYIHPDEVTRLLKRLQAAVAPAHVSATVPLAEAEPMGFDAARLAWTVSQVLSGGLAVVGWLPPYRVIDLLVDEGRLSRLSDWPDCERRA